MKTIFFIYSEVLNDLYKMAVKQNTVVDGEC